VRDVDVFCRSELQVPSLLQQVPVGELLAEGEALVFREAKDIEFLVVNELGATLRPEVRLDIAQVLGRETRLCVGASRPGDSFSLRSMDIVHSLARPYRADTLRILLPVLCTREGRKILHAQLGAGTCATKRCVPEFARRWHAARF
jgi:hypothetical protein